MKVLFVHSSNFNYGVEPFIKSQGESLVSKVIELDYFPVIGKGLKGYYRNISNLKRITKNYDIIHAHYGLIGLLCIISLTKKPIVLSVMGSDAYGSYNQDGKRIPKSYFIMFLTQIAMFFSNAIIAKSTNIVKYIPYKTKTKIIPNGVNFSIFKSLDKKMCRNELNFYRNKKILLFLANPSDPRKNFTLVEEAFKKINNKNILLLNPYPIKQKEFVKYLNASDVFVLTSFNEGSPNVIKEAMACNIPIVSTDVGDVKEVIGNTEGCYITAFNPDDVAQKIQLAIDFGKRTTGRKDIKHLETEVIAQKIINVYKELV